MLKKAFSLIELLIVIVIIGVVYTLAVQGIQKMNEKESSLSISTLKEYLTDREYEKSVRLLCLDDCSICDIFVDGKKSQKIEEFLDSEVRFYRYELLYGFIEKEKGTFFNENDVEEDVCFSYTINKEGIGDQVLIEYKESFYDLSPYFSQTLEYSSLEDALEYKENLLKEVRQ